MGSLERRIEALERLYSAGLGNLKQRVPQGGGKRCPARWSEPDSGPQTRRGGAISGGASPWTTSTCSWHTRPPKFA